MHRKHPAVAVFTTRPVQLFPAPALSLDAQHKHDSSHHIKLTIPSPQIRARTTAATYELSHVPSTTKSRPWGSPRRESVTKRQDG